MKKQVYKSSSLFQFFLSVSFSWTKHCSKNMEKIQSNVQFIINIFLFFSETLYRNILKESDVLYQKLLSICSSGKHCKVQSNKNNQFVMETHCSLSRTRFPEDNLLFCYTFLEQQWSYVVQPIKTELSDIDLRTFRAKVQNYNRVWSIYINKAEYCKK